MQGFAPPPDEREGCIKISPRVGACVGAGIGACVGIAAGAMLGPVVAAVGGVAGAFGGATIVYTSLTAMAQKKSYLEKLHNL